MNIQNLRKKQGLTQGQLAHQINVDISTLSKYESGAISPSSEKLKLIAEALHVSVDDLLGDSLSENVFDSYSSALLSVIYRSIGVQKRESIETVVSENLINVSNGICELCEKPAPFFLNNRTPYLEACLLFSRSEYDIKRPLNNWAALCPNCNRKIRLLHYKPEIEYLRRIASNHMHEDIDIKSYLEKFNSPFKGNKGIRLTDFLQFFKNYETSSEENTLDANQ